MKRLASLALLCVFGTAPAAHAANVCAATAQSGPATAALVELYTSEGCSSCTPADRQLSRLREEVGAQASVVPLALHVTYWDALGWKDFLAQSVFDARQHELAAASQSRFSYTPEFFINGAELRAWRGALPDAIRQVNARPAAVAIALTSTASPNGRLTLDASVTAHGQPPHAALYLAVTESALKSPVGAGENRGATLMHDNAVRVWMGPMPLASGNTHIRREVQLPPVWNRQQLHAVAFVQDMSDGVVLQAVESGACGASAGPDVTP